MKKRLWITGYRSFELGAFNDQDPKVQVVKRAIKDDLVDEIENNDLEWLITSGQLGVEQWASETAIDLKKTFPTLKIAIMLPFSDFGSQWNPEHQSALLNLRSQVDFSQSLTQEGYKSPIQLRNFQQFMLTHTDEALMVYDPENTGKADYDYKAIKEYQGKHPDYTLKLIDFDMLTDLSEEMEEERREW
ncbi:MAG: DUF1273 domain-containing protein [Oenococcus sp.]|uniref:UPF0398 protein OKIT_1373 n=1 Tax=Oenococcus kitaharae DSM 17330 TaxID=1045004 RepID=G9WFT3_9LACO|nr:DUF1273 domain-containing protein [Oenococcus kitaharae]EHN59456.1 hypothetical protein OKIT_1373 [Oenococcus kitaharae DSM 17330]MCV3295876.1 DUF1273 domain-containing protein [Oenococcus kitaharae]OEY83324.1 hypothetical protein NT95_04070 [Oenococcus kitaharae]OEY85122.1 hypothetical protein NT96_00510 [Oenococcus kitaharae]OEY85977.1 hypothetical protein NV75_00460 [Oenococcus kitaharae]